MLDGGVISGSDDFFLGVGAEHQGQSLFPSDAVIQDRIGPALLAAVLEEGGTIRKEGALVALAKLHPKYSPEGTTILDVILAHLDNSQQSVADAAVVALGLMRDASVVSTLLAIASDAQEGRALLKTERVALRIRSLAAYSLGQVAAAVDNVDVRRYVAHGLTRILNEEREASPDLHVACITSLGLTPMPQTAALPITKGRARKVPSTGFTREAQLNFLIAILNDNKRHEVVRSHVPKALALLARDGDERHQELALDAILDVLESGRNAPRLLRHGLVDAVGVFADSDEDAIDARARRALHAVVADGQPIDRGLALVALGLASSRPGNGEGDPLASLDTERTFLMRYFARGKSNTRSWAALALGLQGYHGNEAGSEVSAATGRALSSQLEQTRSPVRAGAQALALGLRRDLNSSELLIERLEEERDETLRAQIAISLGLLGDRSAIVPLEKLMAASNHQPMLLRDSSIALAMLGQKGVVLDLVDVIRDGPNHYVKAASVTALGLVGDMRAVEPLLEMLEDRDQQEQSRGFAAMALGVICEETTLPWNAGFSNHLNYNAMTYTLNNNVGTGILNFR